MLTIYFGAKIKRKKGDEVVDKIKYQDGEYVKVYWTDSILKIRYDIEKPGYDDDDVWYGCEKSEYSPAESNYYCNIAQNDVIGIATEEEFLKSRKESFEFCNVFTINKTRK